MDEQLHATSLVMKMEELATFVKYLMLSFPFIGVFLIQLENWCDRLHAIKECRAQKKIALSHLNNFVPWLEEMRLICAIEYIPNTSHVATEVQTLIKHSIQKCLEYIDEIESVYIKRYLRKRYKESLIFSFQQKQDWVKDVKEKIKNSTGVHYQESVATTEIESTHFV